MLGIERSAWLLALLSAILQVVIFPLPNLYVLGWIALAPLLVALLDARRPPTLQLEGLVRLDPATARQGFLLGYISGILWYGGSCYWVFNTMRQYGGIGPYGAAGLLLLFCLYLALYHGAFGLSISVLARSSRRAALVFAPLVWVAIELARTRISGFPWDLLGTSQVDNLPLARIAGFTGVYGVSLEIMVVNAALAAGFLVHHSRRKSLVAAALAAATLLQIGRWLPVPGATAGHVALLVQENVPVVESAEWTRQYFDDTLADLERISLRSGEREHRRPDLVVWPESPAPFYTGDPLFRMALTRVSMGTRSWVVAGSIGVENANLSPRQPTRVYNSAVVVGPAGEWNGRYDKVHLVPFGEYVPFKNWLAFAGGLTREVGDFSRGTSRRPLSAGEQKLGVFICYESVFPDEVRRFAKAGAEVFVNISNDGWYGDSGAYAQHLEQARMRAVENARWLLRATNTGVTTAIDPEGRLVARVPRKLRTVLEAPYTLTDRTTFYTRHGDWLAYGCAIISLAAIAVSLVRRRDTSQ